MGRALLCAPYFASAVLAATAILNAGTEDQKRALLPNIASGETIATLAIAEDSGLWTGAGVVADGRAGEGRVHGSTGPRASCSTATRRT